MYRESNARLLDTFKNAFAPTLTSKTNASDDNLPAPRFIDIGCGTGNFTLNYLLPRCSCQCLELVVVDNSPAMLEYARIHHSHEKIRYEHLDIVEGDVDRFVTEHGLFARLFSFNSMHWIKDKARAFRNMEKLMHREQSALSYSRSLSQYSRSLWLWQVHYDGKKHAEVLLERVPSTACCMDITSLRAQLWRVLNETNLTPLACEVLRLPVVEIPNLDDATDRIVSYNPIYRLIKEKDELIQSTRKILAERAQGITEGRVRNYRFTFVIHAFKPTEASLSTDLQTE
ncbi:hypothetical protein HPB51_001933 [Rhipicephalus microplus]|uniref:Methyltransferase domain-containing protein n=1 Tax=Rhipicephalus microplus TaxID=6941 RepID=A0A9J6DLH6_RHIMP|nr:hypothetical protein HPB51_001933 [Rhipicephalus microplus]